MEPGWGNGGIQRGKSSCGETGVYALDGGEVDPHLPDVKIDEVAEDGMIVTMEMGFEFWITPSGIPCRVIPAATVYGLPSI